MKPEWAQMWEKKKGKILLQLVSAWILMYNERMPDIELPGGKYGHRDQTSPQTYGRLLKGYLQKKRDGALGFELM